MDAVIRGFLEDAYNRETSKPSQMLLKPTSKFLRGRRWPVFITRWRLHRIVIGAAGCSFLILASSRKSDEPLNDAEAAKILAASAWVQQAAATFALAGDDTPPEPEIVVPQAGMPQPPNAATDGHWDGGVGRVNRNGTPTLNVTVRWDSALPVREAQARGQSHELFTQQQAARDYIVTIIGLVPGGHYQQAPALDSHSSSDESANNARNPEQMLEGVMHYSGLYPRNRQRLAAENVKLDARDGSLHLFFRRDEAAPLTLRDKEVVFQTRFGTLSVAKKFRLKDMTWRGKLEL